ncbi:YhgE/Pip domain-containing protein, partial [Microbacterium sp.]|uniref:YhgE/Pip domain-containing protein n=1 Tax=Microbacterium sp. TaxID=51671 RepID=UPI003A84286B
MTLPLERARSRRPITWLTLAGVLLLPVLVGGILVAALYNPAERLDAMHTAVVNNDEPVTVDGQYVPLGRQLSAGLVAGADDEPSNLTWTISNDDDAAAGLADGTYDAVVTIPADFSAAATSTAPGGTPTQALIEVTTSPDSLIVDDAITAQVARAATSVLGRQLSTVYLENVFLGFTTLGEQLGEAADGAGQLAAGAGTAADGSGEWADGAASAASGAAVLADGIRDLSSGAAELAGGAGGVASGSAGISAGAAQLAAGADAAATGLDAWAGGADRL